MIKKITLFCILFLVLFSKGVNAKTVNWDFETQSTNFEKLECLKVIDVKSNRSALTALANMGMYTETPFIVRIQNNCKDEIEGSFTIKLLDKDGFMLEDWLENFKIGRKGLRKVSFEMLLSSLKWKKVKSVLLEFDF